MPTRRQLPTEVPFLFVGFDNEGRIQTAATIRVNANQGRQAAAARSEIVGLKKFLVYRIREQPDGSLQFEPL